MPASMTPARAEPSQPSSAMKMDSGPTRYTDVQFMQGMIAHHAQSQ
jgi:uncharacterized protein (DUF305 family)